MSPKAEYKITWEENLPEHVTRHQYPRRWSAARGAIRDLQNGNKSGVLKITLKDARATALCKSAIYSEGHKIRESGSPDFKPLVTTHVTDSGRYELYVEVNEKKKPK